MKRFLPILAALILLCAAIPAQAGYHLNEQGLYVDDSGQVIDELWDEAAGIYIVAGVAHAITPSGEGPTDVGTGIQTGAEPTGALVVTSTETGADLPRNPDGSIVVESGQLPIEEEAAVTESHHLTQEEWAARWAKYASKNGTTTGTVYMDENGNVYPVQILQPGLGRSTILLDGQERIVPTSSLKWESEAPQNKLLAVSTPSTQSYLTLRAKSSQKAFVMGHCDKCSVLLVIRTGKTWTFVDNGEVRGYVMTSGLTFYDNEPRQYAAGIITVKGKTPSGNTVHVRSAASRKGRQIEEYPVGTPITVFSQDDEWSEIDVGGFHCYIQSKYVTLQEPLLLAEAGPGLAEQQP